MQTIKINLGPIIILIGKRNLIEISFTFKTFKICIIKSPISDLLLNNIASMRAHIKQP